MNLSRTALLAAPVFIVLGSAVYFLSPALVWGQPLLQDQSEPSQSTESQVREIKSSVIAAAENRSSAQVNLEISEDANISVNGEQDYIRVVEPAENAIYSSVWMLVDGTSLQGVSIGIGSYGLKGMAQPAIIAAKSRTEQNSRVYHLEFRSLRSMEGEPQLELIDITGDASSTGDTELDADFLRNVTDQVTTDAGETLQRQKKVVQVSLS